VLEGGFRECWLVVPEGNGKTTLLSTLALYHCEHTLSGAVPIAASSREQAEIMYRQGEGFVLRTERLRAVFRCQEGYRRIRCDRMGSRIQVFAADDRTGDGVIPTLPLIDELHRHRDLRLYRTWRGKLEKRGGTIVAISTAGEPGLEFEITRETIRKTAVGDGDFQTEGCFTRARAGRVVMHEWAVAEDGDPENLELVKAANPFSGVTIEALAEKLASPTMTLAHWRRFVCNLPTRSHAAAIQEREWYDARTEVEIPVGTPVWLGLDVGWKWDTTALVPLWWRDDHFRLLGPARVLVPPRDGSSLHPDEVEAVLLELHERNPLHTVVMDSTKAEQLAAWIADELDAEVIDRAQSHSFAVEDYNRFMEALREGWLKHSGDAELTRHALNAIARVLPQGDARFERPSSTRQGGDQEIRVIDALVAAAMVHSTAAIVAEPRQAFVAFA
jgi:phage terminase large subunit-like protein